MSIKQRVLYFAVSGLGDNLFAVPALMELEERYQLSVVVPAGAQAELFQALLPQARVLPLGEGWIEALKIARQGFRYDYWIYSIGSSFRRTRMINLLGQAKRRYAFTSLSTLNAWQLELGFDICMVPDFGRRAWQNNYSLLSLLDPEYLKRTKPWDTYSAEARRRIQNTSRGTKTAQSSLFIHAGSNKYVGRLERYKRWPVKQFLTVADQLVQKGHFDRVDFFTGPADDDLMADYQQWTQAHQASRFQIYGRPQHQNDLVGIARHLLNSTLFLGNDSGLAHLAALLGLPNVVVMSSSGQPSYTAPDGLASSMVVHPVPCQGCTIGITGERALQFECPNEWECMAKITPEEVVNQVLRLLRPNLQKSIVQTALP